MGPDFTEEDPLFGVLYLKANVGWTFILLNDFAKIILFLTTRL
jgi:hypothetical protein